MTDRGPRALPPGTEVGGHQLVELVGQGGTGAVYRARDPAGETVALKLLELDGDLEALSRFQREAAALAALPRRPELVAVRASGVDKRGPYLVMDYVEGELLSARLARAALAPPAAALLVERLADALEEAHQRGVLHRDVKASNVLVRPDGTPVLGDFGAAAVRGSRPLTRTGDVVGTPLAMAPEQVRGERERIDPRTDVWGLGALLYHCLAGQPPFRGRDLAETLRNVLRADPAPLPVDARLWGILQRALARDPGARFPAAGSLATAIRSWRHAAGAESGASSPSLAAASSRRALRRGAALLALGGALLLVTVVALGLRRGDEPGAAESALAEALERALPDALGEQPLLLAPELADQAARYLEDGAPRAGVSARLARALLRCRFEEAVARGEPTDAPLERLAALEDPSVPVLRARLALAADAGLDAATLAALEPLANGRDALAEPARRLLVRGLQERDPAAARRWALRLQGPAQAAAERQLALWRALHGGHPAAVEEVLRSEGRALDHALGRALAWQRARVEALAGGGQAPRREELVAALQALAALRVAARRPTARSPLADAVAVAAARLVPAASQGGGGEAKSPDARAPEGGMEGGRPAVAVLGALRRTGLRLLDPRGPATRLLEVFGERMATRRLAEDIWAGALLAYLALDGEVGNAHLAVTETTDIHEASVWGDYLRQRIRSQARDDERARRARVALRAMLSAPGCAIGPVNRAVGLVCCVQEDERLSEELLALLGEARRLDPDSPWVRKQLGLALLVKGDRAGSAAEAEAALESLARGRYLERGTFWQTSAVQVYEDAIELLGRCGRAERARAVCEEGARLLPEQAGLFEERLKRVLGR
ncbi:MAG: protein kinase [Planctomycetota bacterium]